LVVIEEEGRFVGIGVKQTYAGCKHEENREVRGNLSESLFHGRSAEQGVSWIQVFLGVVLPALMLLPMIC
jgi:hypothetical protein